jgi:hypothetical protein
MLKSSAQIKSLHGIDRVVMLANGDKAAILWDNVITEQELK